MEDPPNTGFGMTGVAPEASLYMYKIFSCVSESTNTDVIMAAMIKAASDGVDVISMSLGGSAPFQNDTPYTTLINAITAQGIAVIAANGNDGDIGIYGQSTPASVATAVGVGSVTNLKFPVNYNMKDSLGATFQYQAVWPLILPQALTVYSHGVDCTPDAWESTATAVKDLTNTIILVGLSAQCRLGDQMGAAATFGIQYLIGYNIGQDPVSQDAELEIPFPVTTLVIDPRSGASMLRHIKTSGSTYSLSFTDPTAKSVRMETGGMVSNFSSFGPTWDTVAVKPQLSKSSRYPYISSFFSDSVFFYSSDIVLQVLRVGKSCRHGLSGLSVVMPSSREPQWLLLLSLPATPWSNHRIPVYPWPS
jgi:Subtilase family